MGCAVQPMPKANSIGCKGYVRTLQLQGAGRELSREVGTEGVESEVGGVATLIRNEVDTLGVSIEMPLR